MAKKAKPVKRQLTAEEYEKHVWQRWDGVLRQLAEHEETPYKTTPIDGSV